MKKAQTAIAFAAGLLAWHAASGATGSSLWQGFAVPPDNARPLVRWWWFGPAVEQGELAREIAAMRAGGFGGFEIQPVYPLTLDNPAGGTHNLQFLSDEFLRDVGFAAATARAQGLRADVTLGSGWPYGGPQVPVTQASSQIRMIRIALAAGVDSAALPAVAAGERLLAVFLADGAGPQAVSFDPSAPRVSVAPSAQPRSLLVFLQSRTGQQVKRPGLGGEGFVLDHMNAVAVRQYLDSVGQKLVDAFAGNPPYSLFSDSLEVYGADWTDDLFDQFRRRRGYDLAPHLPALFLDEAFSPAIRHDWALTLSELVDERYLAVGQAWAAAHNTRFRAQVYGTPPVTLSSNRL
ncbi:MAG: glycosyl hydrolase, partial [Rhizomicrobium sp.]